MEMPSNLTEAKEKLARLASSVKRVKETNEQIARRGIDTALTYMGAGVAGAMRGKWGEGADRHVHIPGTEIEVDTAIGTIGTVLGISGLFGNVSDEVTALCSGVGSYSFGRAVEDKVAAGEKK
jgi:hypothetical protein